LEVSGFRFCPRPWKNASEVSVDTLGFPGEVQEGDRGTGACGLSEAIRF